MATRKARTPRAKPTISMDQPAHSSLPGAAQAARMGSILLRDEASATPRMRDISRKVREHLAEETGYVIKGNYAIHLAQTLAQNNLSRFSAYLDAEARLLERARDAQAQANFELFAQSTTQCLANAQNAILYAVVDALGDITLTSIAPDEHTENVEEILVVPGWMAKLFGTKVQVKK